MPARGAEHERTGSDRRWWLPIALTTAALGLFVWSYQVQLTDPWWSSTLGNVAGAMLLLVPADLALGAFRSQVAATQLVAETAQARADVALHTAEHTAESLAEIESRLVASQTAELDREIATYEDVLSNASRDALVAALRQATERGLITLSGVRVPVWWTSLHYRFVLDSEEAPLVVRLEHDDQSEITQFAWNDKEDAETFYGRLVLAVRDAGQDLGTGLNLPTESVSQVVEMLAEVTRLRSQQPLGLRDTLRGIIERREGWYFTEKLVVPADHLDYTIQVSRLGEPDWEEHLHRKGWNNNPVEAIEFARRMYGIPRRSGAAGTATQPDTAPGHAQPQASG